MEVSDKDYKDIKFNETMEELIEIKEENTLDGKIVPNGSILFLELAAWGSRNHNYCIFPTLNILNHMKPNKSNILKEISQKTHQAPFMVVACFVLAVGLFLFSRRTYVRTPSYYNYYTFPKINIHS